MSDLWAYCTTCTRWFYLDELDGRQQTPTCPVCATPASQPVESRAAQGA